MLSKILTSMLITELALVLTAPQVHSQGIVADHEAVAAFDAIPESTIVAIESAFNFFYGHTSHGSQIMSGLDIVQAENALYTPPYFHEISSDLGHSGDISWVQPTRDWLDDHPECNVAMWSWCGGASDNTQAGINAYLTAMNDLEQDYPNVHFIYMTGHLDGSGPEGNLYAMNNLIRAYCAANDKILFDFADIESYDPDGTYYPDETDACYWCSDWCNAHPDCPSCSYCAHSHCFNCYLKGKAFWWLMASMLSPQDQDGDGWNDLTDNCPSAYNPNQLDSDTDGAGDVCDICAGHDDQDDADADGVPDGCDICSGYNDLADYDVDNHPDSCDNCPLIPNPDQLDSDSDGIGDACQYPCCEGATGNVDCSEDNEVTMGDLTVIIDHLFLSYAPVCCFDEANVDLSADGTISIGDLTLLIDHLFVSYEPLPNCP